MKDDYQSRTVKGAAAFEQFNNSYDETKLSKHDFDDEQDFEFDAENHCPLCDNQGNRDKCENCVNGSNYKFEE